MRWHTYGLCPEQDIRLNEGYFLE